jgi:hypothetical protein
MIQKDMLAQNLKFIQSRAGLGGLPSDVGGLISNALPYVFGAAGIALLLYLIMGGFQFMTSHGDPKAMQGAQAKITNALIGFVIVITAYLLVGVLGKIFGIDSFGAIFGK